MLLYWDFGKHTTCAMVSLHIDGYIPYLFVRYEMVSLTLHETNPGHHLQGSYMLEQNDWPLFRKVMEDRIYSQVRYRFLQGFGSGSALV